jgi:CubicO group peptidase (beta-lactamase class C family)
MWVNRVGKWWAPRVALMAALPLAALSGGPAAADDLLPPPLQPGTVIADGQIDKAIAAVDGIASDILARSGLPGMAVVVVRDGKTVFARGYGVRKTGEDARIDPDTVFQIASLSKSISATVVAHAVGEGLVDWDTPVVEHLPWFELSDPYVTSHVTIGDMFAHRSGLPAHAGDELEDIGYDRREVLERLRLMPLHSFRNVSAYTNFGFTAGAEAVAAAAGTDWETLAETTIFKPLGMTSSSYRLDDFVNRENRAFGHVKIDGTWQPKFVRQPDPQAPAGGVSASVNDFGKWLAMVMEEGGDVVPKAALLPATQSQMPNSTVPSPAARPGLYGYGIGTGVDASGRVVLSHSGAFALGTGTNYMLLPLDDIAIGVLTNGSPVGAVEAVSRTFMDMVEFGKPERDWYAAYAPLFAPMIAPVGELVGKQPPSDPSGPGMDDQLLGTFESPYFGPIEIADGGEGLVVKLGPEPMTYALTHWDGRTYVLEPRDENNPDGSVSKLTFAPAAPRERATSVTIEFLDGNGLGTFTRD